MSDVELDLGPTLAQLDAGVCLICGTRPAETVLTLRLSGDLFECPLAACRALVPTAVQYPGGVPDRLLAALEAKGRVRR